MTTVDTSLTPNPDGATPDPKVRAQARKAAEQFESFFIGQMLHKMRSSTRELAGEDSPFKDKVNEDMQDFADDRMADAIAGQHAFGIADVILKQLLPKT
ncbi:rod-binding protein [Pelomonas sp. KK5]|uniref:rod-binding protein n=1 Tax=Pelomonas sp. KK5 TaxID=1855730 RepID=UPI00097BF7A3|nr:rod-binding protein [Pelomonas sp. KK5]